MEYKYEGMGDVRVGELGGGGGGGAERGGGKSGCGDSQQFFTRFLVVFVKHRRLTAAKNTTVSAAILCPTVCVSNVINKTEICGKNGIKHVTSHPFSALQW